ncbi:MAG: hypothetical protein MHM6MM_006352, partial [Cercozoa sp. M6MM]
MSDSVGALAALEGALRDPSALAMRSSVLEQQIKAATAELFSLTASLSSSAKEVPLKSIIVKDMDCEQLWPQLAMQQDAVLAPLDDLVRYPLWSCVCVCVCVCVC